MSQTPRDDKICKVCGRTMTWRKKWEKNWDSIHYCSDACRRDKSSLRNIYEETILSLLTSLKAGQAVCASEILPPEERGDAWKGEKVRQAARRLVAAGKLEILQMGKVVDPSTAKGSIQLRLKPH